MLAKKLLGGEEWREMRRLKVILASNWSILFMPLVSDCWLVDTNFFCRNIDFWLVSGCPGQGWDQLGWDGGEAGHAAPPRGLHSRGGPVFLLVKNVKTCLGTSDWSILSSVFSLVNNVSYYRLFIIAFWLVSKDADWSKLSVPSLLLVKNVNIRLRLVKNNMIYLLLFIVFRWWRS